MVDGHLAQDAIVRRDARHLIEHMGEVDDQVRRQPASLIQHLQQILVVREQDGQLVQTGERQIDIFDGSVHRGMDPFIRLRAEDGMRSRIYI